MTPQSNRRKKIMDISNSQAQKLSKVAEIWMWVYVGMGAGQCVTEFFLYHVLGKLTPLVFLTIGYFVMALVNYHVRQWADKKVTKVTPIK